MFDLPPAQLCRCCEYVLGGLHHVSPGHPAPQLLTFPPLLEPVEQWKSGQGQQISFTLGIQDLESASDIEHLTLPLEVSECSSEEHGTCVTLTHLRQGLRYPSADRLRQELIMEYGRQKDFKIIINGKPLGIDDLEGEFTEVRGTFPDAGDATLRIENVIVQVIHKRHLKQVFCCGCSRR